MDGADGAKPSSGPGGSAPPPPVGPRLRRALVQMLVSRWLALVIGVVALGVLSRLLTPREFGVYAGLLALAALVEVLCGAGVAARLVRLDAPTRAERSAGEGLALLLCCLGGAALLIAALAPVTPLEAEGRAVLALLAPCVVLIGVAEPLEANLSRGLRFGLIAQVGVLRMAAEAGVGIALALAGYGAAALAGGLLAHRCVHVALLLAARARAGDPYAPRLRGAGAFFAFGRGFVLMEAVPKGGDAAVKAILAALLGLGALGLFDRAKQVTGLLDEAILKGVGPIVLPALSRSLQAGEPPRAVYRLKTEILAALVWPAYALVALLAEPLTLTLLGDQWTRAVPVVRILAIAGIALPVGKMSVNLFVALDEVGAYTRIRIVHQAARVALIAGGATQGLLWACAGGVASTFLRAGMIEAALHRRVDHEVADFAPLARDAGILTLATLAGPALILLAWPDAAPLLTVLSGVSAAGLGWLAAACLLRHRLVREALVLLADLRGGRAAGTP